jgi:FdhD protein
MPEDSLLPASISAGTRIWRDATGFSDGDRTLAEETAIAITYNRTTHAVMMATPADLQDFAVGFSLSEEIVPSAEEIEEIEAVEAEGGIELRLWIPPERMQALERRRRRLAGATGCGMCGLESLAEALRPIPAAPKTAAVSASSLRRACAALRPAQALNAATRAVHGAGFWTGIDGMVAVREDVGRHNALDKLTGALAAAGVPAASGILLLTSRISIELVQKAARLGAPIVAAVSAPTALAVRAAEASGMTLVGVARDDGFEVFTHPWRVENTGRVE